MYESWGVGPPIRVMVRIQSSSTLSDVRPCKQDDHPGFAWRPSHFSFFFFVCLLILKLSRLSTIQLAAAVNSAIKRLIYNDREKRPAGPPGQSFQLFIKKLFGALDLAWWRSGINNSSPAVSFVYISLIWKLKQQSAPCYGCRQTTYSPRLHIAGVAQLFCNGEFNLRVVPLSL